MTRRCYIALLLCAGCALAAPPESHLEGAMADDDVTGTFRGPGGAVEYRGSSSGSHAELHLDVNGKSLDIAIDLDTRHLVEDAHGNTFDFADREVLVALRDAIETEHPEWRDSLHGMLLDRTADRYAEVPIGPAMLRHQIAFTQTMPTGKADTVSGGCGDDGVTCFPGEIGMTWAIFRQNGTCQATKVEYGDSSCRGRCGMGCNIFDADYTWDCLDHDVCLDHSSDCSTEFNEAADDWAMTIGPYCLSGSSRPAPTFASGPIAGVFSSKCLDTGWTKDNGTNVVLWSCHGGQDQQWTLEPIGDGTYRIVGAYSGKCLDLRGGNHANGTLVQQWDCVETDNQRWSMRDMGGGNFELVSRVSNKCLDSGWQAPDGFQLLVWDCGNAQTDQLWHR